MHQQELYQSTSRVDPGFWKAGYAKGLGTGAKPQENWEWGQNPREAASW